MFNLRPRAELHERVALKVIACCVLITAGFSLPVQGGALDGATVYKQKCVRCHGPSGEGTEKYARLLAGDRTVPALSRLIAKTMPEDAPGECVGAEAEAVARYIHESFYSREAQAKRKGQGPRIELARLTVRQYRETVADLVGSFHPAVKLDVAQGLTGDYSSRGGRGRNRGSAPHLNRVDPEIRFDFGTSSPIPEQRELEPLSRKWVRLPVLPIPLSAFRAFSQDFHVTWRGSVEAVESGEHEFLVRTENATRLWINDESRALIDAGVKSGNDTEYRGSIRLMAGRRYPIRLEFFRTREKTSSVTLLWKQPGGVFEVIPARRLSPTRTPEVLVLSAPFPPDDRSVGYERGTSVSKAWDQASTEAAIEVADYVSSRLPELADAREGASDREAKVRAFCKTFVTRAFRRPLGPELESFFITRRFEGAKNLETAVKRVVILALKSPRFLYREAGRATPDDLDVASRLSYGLWDSLPDQKLFDEAVAGRLHTPEQVRAQAQRMVQDPRALNKLLLFFLRWFRVEQPPELVKDRKLFPGFDEAVAADLRTSLRLFLEDLVSSPTADFRRLFDTESIYLNGRLSKLYGGGLKPDARFQQVKLEPNVRAGVLTHPYLAANFAYTGSTSPIHRGVFISRSLLGRVLLPPPEAVAPLPADLHPGMTTRERITLQTKPQACVTCHGLINPLGFTLEQFDAIGRYRTQENGKPIDASGTYEPLADESQRFDGARSLAAFLRSSEETRAAFVSQLFHATVQQPIRAFGPDVPARLAAFFASNEFNIRKLLVEMMAISALTPRGPAA